MRRTCRNVKFGFPIRPRNPTIQTPPPRVTKQPSLLQKLPTEIVFTIITFRLKAALEDLQEAIRQSPSPSLYVVDFLHEIKGEMKHNFPAAWHIYASAAFRVALTSRTMLQHTQCVVKRQQKLMGRKLGKAARSWRSFQGETHAKVLAKDEYREMERRNAVAQRALRKEADYWFTVARMIGFVSCKLDPLIKTVALNDQMRDELPRILAKWR